MKKEVWQLISTYDNKIQLQHSGMTILTADKNRRSVGYSQEDLLRKFRAISATPELINIIEMADAIINGNDVKNWQVNDFNKQLELVKNKIKGKGEIKAPNHCRTSYEWIDQHIENYHKQVNELKSKL